MNGSTTGVNGPTTWGTTWLIVTGASRGFGASLCKCLAEYLADDSVIVGMARSKSGLNDTAALVKKVNPKIKFVSMAMDLGSSTSEQLSNSLKSSLDGTDLQKFRTSVIIHNAGSLGKLDYLRDIDDMDSINEYFNFNISSVLSLNTTYLKIVKTMLNKPKNYVLHTSSLCAIQPVKSWGLYCIGKAARDMMFRMIATEDKDINVLSYAPGPLDNQMQTEIQKQTSDPEVKEMFTSLKNDNKLLPCDTSVRKMITILAENKYKSGDHVDFYDEL